MSSSWHSLIIRLGERSAEYGQSDIEEQLETCLGCILRELQDSREEIIEILMQCAEELPHKDPLYGTLVGLINAEDGDFAAKIVEQTHSRMQAALDLGDCNKFRILLRFLTVLMNTNVVSPGSLVEVFETLLSSAATTVDDERGNPAWQPRADFYVFCILASLPWGGIELFERVPEELERVVAGVEAYLSIRKPISQPAYCAFSSEEDESKTKEDQDFLVDLWTRVKELQENGWSTESVPRPHIVFEARLALCQTHEFNPVNCPDTPELPSMETEVAIGKQRHEAEKAFPQRMRRLRIFPSSKTDAQIALIDRFIVEEYMLDVLFYLNGCRKEFAAYMAGLPVPFRYEFIMAEVVFSQLLLLPKPPFKQIYYTIVIIDLCKALPGAFPTVVAAAVRELFNRIDTLDIECRTRLVSWFAHHLSNFQFVWPWEEWTHVIDLPKWSPQQVFVREILEKEVRFSYLEKIRQSLEANPKLFDLLPPKSSPVFKYSAENHESYTDTEITLSTELTGMVKGKKTARDIQIWMEEKIWPFLGHKGAIEIVVQTLLYIGSKSFTHLITVFERYGQVFSKCCRDQDLQVYMIEEISKVWQNNAQMTAIAIDRMMGYRIISNLAIVKWVFSERNIRNFHLSDSVWEVLRNAITKTNNRTLDLRKELNASQKALQAASEATNKALLNFQSAESLKDAAETEETKAQATSKAEWAKSIVEKRRQEETSTHESLQAIEALLARALKEQQDLLLAVFGSFASILTEHLSKELPKLEKTTNEQEVQIDVNQDGTAPMDTNEVENKGDELIESESKSGNANKEKEAIEEEQQWRNCTLGHLRAISRQYATEIWEHIGKLKLEVLKDDIHPLVVTTIYSCIHHPL